MTKEAFIKLLELTLEEVKKDASMEGRIEYEWGTEKGTYNVNAFVRTGNDMGQGSCVLITEKLTEHK